MVKSIDFAVRDDAGGVTRGAVAGEGASDFLVVGSGDEISLNLRKTNILKYVQDGNDLQVVLVDGRVITLSGYFNPANGEANELFISADGEITKVMLETGPDGMVFADYGPVQGHEKWNPYDEISFYEGDELIANAEMDEATGMAAFAPLLLGGGGAGLLGAGALAAVAATAGGGSDGTSTTGTTTTGGTTGGTTPTAPVVSFTDGTKTTNDVINAADAANGVTITGNGTPGATITTTVDGKDQTTTVGPDGKWTVTYPTGTLTGGERETPVTVTATDSTGSTTVTDKLVFDTVASLTATSTAGGADGVINKTEAANGAVVTGTADAGSTVTLTLANGTTVPVTLTGTTWTATIPASNFSGDGTLGYTVSATDSHGNSATSVPGTLTYNTTAGLTATSTAGGADSIINKAESANGAVVSGTVDAGSTVTFTLADGTTVPVTVTGGTWTATIPASYVTGQGTVGYTVTATDGYGNVATPVAGSLAYDTLASLSATSTAGGSDGVVNNAEGTNGALVSGTVDSGSTVTFTLDNGVTVPVTMTSATTWAATIPAAYVTGEGTRGYTVTAIDNHNNVATPVSGSVKYDTLVNNFTLTSSTGGTDGVVSKTEAGAVTVGGQVEAGSTVTVTLANGATVPATVNGTTWTASIPQQYVTGEGSLGYTAVARDVAGNTSSSLAGTVKYDTILNNLTATAGSASAGSDGYVNKAEGTNGAVIGGTVEAGATSVIVTLADGTQIPGTVSGNTWSATIPAAKIATGEGTINYTVAATDAYGNTTGVNGSVMNASGSVNYDAQVMNFAHGTSTTQVAGGNGVVNINEAAAGVTVGGTVEAGSSVSVMVNGQSYAATVSGTSWTVTLPSSVMTAGSAGTVNYTVNATDSHANTASLAQSFTYDLAAPDAVDVIGKAETNNIIEMVKVDDPTSALDFHQVLANGTALQIDELKTTSGMASAWYELGDGIPDGSYLVVSTTDASGNQSATLAVLNEDTATTVDLTRAGLSNFDFSMIDLERAADATLTITDADIKRLTNADHTLMVQGDSADHVIATGAHDTGLDKTVDGHTYSVYTLGSDSELLIETTITNVTI